MVRNEKNRGCIWINDDTIFQTIEKSNFDDKCSDYDNIWNRTISISVGNDCDKYLEFYFDSVNNLRYPGFGYDNNVMILSQIRVVLI